MMNRMENDRIKTMGVELRAHWRRKIFRRVSGAVAIAALACLAAPPFATAQPPQHDMSQMHMRLDEDVKLTVDNDLAKQVVTLRLGPMRLPANTGHMGLAQPPDRFWSVPFNGWLVAYHPRLVDAAGRDVPGILLHHVAMWNTRRSDFLCRNKEEHIFGAGSELTDWPQLPGFGYRVAKSDRMRIETMFSNPTNTDYQEIYLEIRVEYRTPDSPGAAGIKNVYPAWFDVMSCKNSGYDLAAGPSTTTGNVTLRYSGTLLGVGGHLHDYGHELALTDLTQKAEIATLDAKLDPQGHLLSIPVVPFTDRGGLHLPEGDKLETRAMYDNPTGKAIPDGAMGIVVGYFLPDSDAAMAALRRAPHAAGPAKQPDN